MSIYFLKTKEKAFDWSSCLYQEQEGKHCLKVLHKSILYLPYHLIKRGEVQQPTATQAVSSCSPWQRNWMFPKQSSTLVNPPQLYSKSFWTSNPYQQLNGHMAVLKFCHFDPGVKPLTTATEKNTFHSALHLLKITQRALRFYVPKEDYLRVFSSSRPNWHVSEALGGTDLILGTNSTCDLKKCESLASLVINTQSLATKYKVYSKIWQFYFLTKKVLYFHKCLFSTKKSIRKQWIVWYTFLYSMTANSQYCAELFLEGMILQL